MKIKKRTQKRMLKYFICTVLLFSILGNLSLMAVSAITENEAQTTSNSTSEGLHEYHGSVIDGALYYLMNVGNRQYLTVDNGSPEMFTTLSTASLTNATHQQFRMEYMGSDTYRIVPRHTEGVSDPNAIDGKMYVCPEWYDSGEIVSIYAISQFWGGFRLQRLGENKYIILTEASDFTCALAVDTANPNRIIHKNYSSMTVTEKLHAQWCFISVSSEYESYNKYYIRAINTKLYLEASDINAPTIQAAPFDGTEAQQWKLSPIPGTNTFHFSPLNNLYNYLENRDDIVEANFIERNEDLDDNQHLFMEYFLDDLGGFKSYFIGVTVDGATKYLGIAGFTYGSTDTYELIWTDNPELYTVWTFEEVLFDDPSIRAAELYTPQYGLIADYHDDNIFVLKNGRRPTRYKIVLRGSEAYVLNIYKDRNLTEPIYFEQVNSVSLNGEVVKMYDTMLEAHTYYYFCVQSTGIGEGTYSFMLNPFAISVHLGSLNVGENSNLQHAISQGFNSSWYHIENMNWNLSTKELISASNALTATHSASGISDFRSDVFVYNGHGLPGYACYIGANNATYLAATQIPDMDGCELAIWASCYSAAISNGTSMVHASKTQGAKVAMGWSKAINTADLKTFLNGFWDQISSGKSINEAMVIALALPKCTCVSSEDYERIVNDPELAEDLGCKCAKNGVCECVQGPCPCSSVNHYTYYYYTYGIVDSLVILGDGTNVLYGIAGEDSVTASALNSIESDISIQQRLLDKSEYTLMSENAELGLKLYSKLLNGIPTDDCYIEYYKDGVLVDAYKSPFKLEDAETQVSAMQTNEALKNNPGVDVENLAYTYRDGAWHLIERREIVTTQGDFTYTEIAYVDLSEGVEIY